jgi:hypothetical protein
MEPQNAACQILAHLNVYAAMLGTQVKYRGPTPERMKKGAKAGMFGKGLRNQITRNNLARMK